jgi:hypothetical protein
MEVISMPFKHDDKKAGDVLKSADWNAGMQEVVRLDKDKVDRTGDTITGSLAIGNALTVVGNTTLGTPTAGSQGALTLQGRVSGQIASTLTLRNLAGGANSGGALDFNGYDVGSHPPTARVRSLDDGNSSSHLGFYTKDPGAPANPLQERLRIQSNGNVGIGTSNPVSKLTINADIAHDSNFNTYGDAPLTLFEPTSNGGSTPNGTRDILNLVREGITNQAYGNKVSLAIGRYENDGVNSRTQLDIKLTDGSFSSHTAVMSLRSNGRVGIGTTDPKAQLQVTGAVSITSVNSNNFANMNNHMAPGSLTIGGIDRNYGGGSGWTTNTAGLLLETLDNTEIAVHDSGRRLASLMYYEGSTNKFTIGRDMSWGAISTVEVAGKLKSNNVRTMAVATDSIKTTSTTWTDFPNMSVTATTGAGAVLVLLKAGGVQGSPGQNVRIRFRLLVDNVQKAFTLHEFHNAGWELRDLVLTTLETLTAGSHTFKVEWYAEGGTANASWYSDTRSLLVLEL